MSKKRLYSYRHHGAGRAERIDGGLNPSDKPVIMRIYNNQFYLKSMQTKTRYKCSCIFALVFLACLFFSKTSHASDLVPAIEVQPGNNVEVGEEVYFSGTGTTYPDATLL
ncbi:MAG: hypothetical protein PHQ46_09300, partial [Negativicutes bacterium]|nr:hypothetical protein [Negativicutes bacterium]